MTSAISLYFLLSFSFILFLTECLSIEEEKTRGTIHSTRICKPGPEMTEREPFTARRKCLVIGDSVSIGYTPWLRQRLSGVCDVFHAPWDTTDGGAQDTKYGLQCLQYFLSTVDMKSVKYDAIVFNFGLHDVNYSLRYPEEYTNETLYLANLKLLKERLLGTGSKLGFVFTTPVPWSAQINNLVKRYNEIAKEVMSNGVTIATADLYHWVVKVCGEPPYQSCPIAQKQPSPHYTPQGYSYLSELVMELVKTLLNEMSSGKRLANIRKDDPNPVDIQILPIGSLDNTQTVCPAGATRLPCEFSGSLMGCCPLPNAVCCHSKIHCCPAGFECNAMCNATWCSCSEPLHWDI